MYINGVTFARRKSRQKRNILILASALVLLVFITTLLISVYTAWSLTHPSKKAIPAFSTNVIPPFDEVSFPDIKKTVTLKGWFFKSGTSDKTIIISHGYKGNRLIAGEDKNLSMTKTFLAKGFNVLLYDFRNSGLSGGKVTSVGIFEKDDLLGAVEYVKSQGSRHVVLIGFSMGASTSILAAAETKDTVDAVIADSPFSDLREYLNDNLPTWSHLPSIFNNTTFLSVKLLTGLEPADASPKKVIHNIAPRPVLLIHSKDDSKIPSSNSKELYDVYSKVPGNSVEFWETQGADHIESYSTYPQEYMTRVFNFLDKVYSPKN